MLLPFQAGAALTTGLDPDLIIDRGSNPLLATQVAFRRLNGNMPQKELDLFQLPSRSMAEAGAGATQVVRRQSAPIRSVHDVPDGLLGHAFTQDPPHLRHS